MKKVLVIGGGPAGMIAAGTAAQNGHEVLLFEKNSKLGKKLYITGKGRCNLTNACEIDELFDNIITNANFLYSSIYSFDNISLMNFFERLGVAVKTERGGRVFPKSEKASDIVHALERYLQKNNVAVHLNTPIKSLIEKKGAIQGIVTADDCVFDGDAVIIATGGLSYPMTGSTGDGYRLAKEVGHTITKLSPSIVPLKAKENWVMSMQGLTLKNIAIDVQVKNKSVYKDFGEMVFTHYGVSGPVILSASRYLLGKFEHNPTIFIDLKPALEYNELDARILRDFQKYINKDFKNSLDDLLPQKLISVIIELSGISPVSKVNGIKKEARKKLADLLKRLRVDVYDTMGYNEAVITCGGVNVKEVNPSTMESKVINGLSFAGEILDVDAFTGGFNLQIAFSTGYLAGMSIE